MHRSSCSCHSHDGFLTVRGYAENVQREAILFGVREMALTAGALEGILDKVGSVSGLSRLDPQIIPNVRPILRGRKRRTKGADLMPDPVIIDVAQGTR